MIFFGVHQAKLLDALTSPSDTLTRRERAGVRNVFLKMSVPEMFYYFPLSKFLFIFPVYTDVPKEVKAKSSVYYQLVLFHLSDG